MTHQYAGRQLSYLGLVAGDRPGEDVDLDAPLGKALGHLDDIDVQTARVAGPRLLERRRVNAYGRDPP